MRFYTKTGPDLLAGTGLKYTLKSVCRNQIRSSHSVCGYYYARYNKARKTYDDKAQGSKNGHRKRSVQAAQAYIVGSFGARTGIDRATRAAVIAGVKAVEITFKHRSRLLS